MLIIIIILAFPLTCVSPFFNRSVRPSYIDIIKWNWNFLWKRSTGNASLFGGATAKSKKKKKHAFALTCQDALIDHFHEIFYKGSSLDLSLFIMFILIMIIFFIQVAVFSLKSIFMFSILFDPYNDPAKYGQMLFSFYRWENKAERYIEFRIND